MLTLIVYTMLFALLISTCYMRRMKQFHVPAKLLNSLGFIMVAAIGLTAGGDRKSFYWMLPAFLLCLLGDFFLAVNECKPADKMFLAGLGSFLLGHIAFLTAFHQISPVRWYDLIFPLLMVPTTLFLTKLLQMEVGKMLTPVLIYAFFVSMLLSKALSLAAAGGLSSRNMFLVSGAALFFLSDVIILFLFFYRVKFRFGVFINLFTYYYGLLLLAFSVWYH